LLVQLGAIEIAHGGWIIDSGIDNRINDVIGRPLNRVRVALTLAAFKAPPVKHLFAASVLGAIGL
jgi:hypothetical protein